MSASPSRSRSRPPGTAGASEPETRATILAAAERLFARNGFSATTIKQIGAESGVNTALIYYYFDDKQGLHQAVINSFGEELFDRAKVALSRAASPEDIVRAIVTTQSGMFSGYPERARILARELIDHDAAHAGELLQYLSRHVFTRLREAIAEGQRDGRFRRDLEPGYAALSVVAQVVYFHLARPVVQAVLRGQIGKAEEQAFAEHAAHFALAALREPAPVRRRSPRKRQ